MRQAPSVSFLPLISNSCFATSTPHPLPWQILLQNQPNQQGRQRSETARSNKRRLPNQRWQIATAQADQAEWLAQTTQLPPLLSQVLINRGIDTAEAAQTFLYPETQLLPSPLEEFPDLTLALELLMRAIALHEPIAICGDYDADGMTSTALLLRALRSLGAIVDYAIPSRMQEGYGINQRIVEEFHDQGVRLILTVDNGIAAHAPIARARELGLAVIVTDHHDVPPDLPRANAILNPKLIREDSPYRGVAGVGVAYILAVCLAQCLKQTQDLTTPLIELFTLGTIADLAPLTGVNRRWVRRGLKLLPQSKLAGVQALIQVAGLGSEQALKPEAIGFRLGPRINAVGRIADPQIVIELLTTDQVGEALELAMKCEQINQHRQRLCELIEQEAIAWCESSKIDVLRDRVIVVVQPNWHHGVIGIVASRLVERYGVPVFIGTYEDESSSRCAVRCAAFPNLMCLKRCNFVAIFSKNSGGTEPQAAFHCQQNT
jgi:single-stranded-DNA-specific exonuclease